MRSDSALCGDLDWWRLADVSRCVMPSGWLDAGVRRPGRRALVIRHQVGGWHVQGLVGSGLMRVMFG
jgi:hypothetical protein